MAKSDLVITSRHNPRLRSIARLRKRSERDKSQLFLIEDYRALSRALKAGLELEEIYYSPDWFLGTNERKLLDIAQKGGTWLSEVGKEAFASVSYRDRPEGLLATAKKWDMNLDKLQLGVNPLVVVVERIEKPGNLGTILRSADAAGADCVILCDPRTDPFNPNVIRSSTGVIFSMPLAQADNLSVLNLLRQNKIDVIATLPDAKDKYTDVQLDRPLALVMGNEQYGLSKFWQENADTTVSIPMAGMADSLNVAMATLVTLFEAQRQRSKIK